MIKNMISLRNGFILFMDKVSTFPSGLKILHCAEFLVEKICNLVSVVCKYAIVDHPITSVKKRFRYQQASYRTLSA